MKHLLLFLVLLGLATCCYSEITEWPLTLHHGIQSPVGKTSNRVDELGGLPVVDPPYHSAGYISLSNTHDAKLFYFYFQERNKDPEAPLLFWTNGGPGCSSMFGLFKENGPYTIQEDLSLTWNEYGWDLGQNVVFVDQPVGTGFSMSGDDRDYARYEGTVGKDMMTFFEEFMEIHPELRGKDFYMSGESYAGHYLPAIADVLHQANKAGEFTDLNLKGVLMGNPWTSPLDIELSYLPFAKAHGLISQKTAKENQRYDGLCKSFSRDCNTSRKRSYCEVAYNSCQKHHFDVVLEQNSDLNVYDIRKKCVSESCYDESLLIKYLNSPEVQAQIGAQKKWVECSDKVGKYMAGDSFLTMGPTVEKLLNDGLRFIVYVGDQDFICNWMGNKAWLDSMKWAKADEWAGTLKEWEIDTKAQGKHAAGECETVEPLTFCKISQAGHMVPMDQPESALAMVHTFIAGDAFVKPDPTRASMLRGSRAA